MKKLLVLISASLLVLGACGNEEKNKTETAKSEKSTKSSSEKVGFKNDKVTLNDIDVTIKDVKLRKADTSTNQDTDQLLIDYTVKNKSDKEIDVMSAWQVIFEATQEDENTERKLDVGMSPSDGKYEKLLDRQMDNIKKGGTSEGVVAYDLEDTKTPVVLTASQGIDGKKLGTKTINLK